jgi:hypothetical protein
MTETLIHSLIVKFWREDGPPETHRPAWHGHITHVPSGERVYARDPNEIPTLVASQMKKYGVRLALCWRLRIWQNGCKRPWKRSA